MKYHFTVVLAPEIDPGFPGYYNVSVPALPGCFSYGATKEEAIENIKEAILAYVEDMEANGEPVPSESIELVKVSV